MNCANHSDREQVAFCQVCGKPVCSECVRKVGAAVYCEPDLAAKLGETSASNPYAAPSGGAQVPPPPPAPNPFGTNTPNPGLAALLGFIPGVGAMYNGQLVKGLIHLGVFAILVSLADNHDIFGLFVAGWVFYQIIEAYQTAVARRDGQPLPDPLGLNDLGDRIGFGKTNWNSFGSSFRNTSTTPPAYTPGPQDFAAGQAPPVPPPPPSQQAAWSAYSYPPPPSAVPYPAVPQADFSSSRIPSGAIWLIGLGLFFLLGTSRHFSFLHAGVFFPLFFIGLGIWSYIRKIEVAPAADQGPVAHRWYLITTLRWPGQLVLLGVLWMLSSLHIMSFGASWPFLLIYAGLMAVAERYASQQMAQESYAPPVSTPPASATTEIVPTPPVNDQEGR